jgi:hypothetical protein
MVKNSDEYFSFFINQEVDPDEIRSLNMSLRSYKNTDTLQKELRELGVQEVDLQKKPRPEHGIHPEAGKTETQEQYLKRLRDIAENYGLPITNEVSPSQARKKEEEWLNSMFEKKNKKTTIDGKTNTRREQQIINFKKWYDQSIKNKTRDELKFKNTPIGTVDLTPMFRVSREVGSKEGIAAPEIGARVKRDIRVLSGEIKPEHMPTKERIIESINKDIDNAVKYKKGVELLQIRNRLLELAEKPKNQRPVNSFDLTLMIDKANSAAQKYYARPLLSSKTDEELKKALSAGYNADPTTRNKLIKAGITDIDKLQTREDIRAAAKKAGIGLRLKDMGRPDYMAKIKEYNQRIPDEELDNLSVTELKQKFKNMVGEIKHPRKIYFVQEEDLPDTPGRAGQLYIKRFGITSTELTPLQIKKENSMRVNALFKKEEQKIALGRPYLTKPEIEKEASKKISAKAYPDTIPVARDLAVQRFMQFKYKTRNKEPSSADLFELARLKDKEYSATIANAVERFKDPETGKVTKHKILIPKEIWKGKREPLIIEGKKQYKKPYHRIITGPAGQIKTIEIKEPKYTDKWIIGGLKQQLIKEAEQRQKKEIEFIKENSNTLLKPLLSQREMATQINATKYIAKDLKTTKMDRVLKESILDAVEDTIRDMDIQQVEMVGWNDVLKEVKENEKKNIKKKK